jgi:hypothetical protein
MEGRGSGLDFQHLLAGIVATAIANGVRRNHRATVGTFDKRRSRQGRYCSPADIPAGLGDFFLRYWMLGHFRSLPFEHSNLGAEVAFGKPLSNLQAEAQKVNPLSKQLHLVSLLETKLFMGIA